MALRRTLMKCDVKKMQTTNAAEFHVMQHLERFSCCYIRFNIAVMIPM